MSGEKPVASGPAPVVTDSAGIVTGAALVTGGSLLLRERLGSFADLLDFWAPGQEAAAALVTEWARPLLEALRRVDAEAAAVRVRLPRRAGAPLAPAEWVLDCLPVHDTDGLHVLVLLTGDGGQVPATVAPQAPAPARVGSEAVEQERRLRRYEALLGAVPQSVWMMSADGVLSRLGGGEDELWYPVGETTWTDAVHPKERDRFRRTWRRALEQRTSLDTVVRVRVVNDSGRYRHIKIVAAPVPGPGGQVEWVGTAADAQDYWHTRMRERLLARMAAVPAARDLSEAFMATAAAVVPELADAVAIFHVRSGDDAYYLTGESTLRASAVGRVALAPGLPPLPHEDPDFLLGPASQRAIESQEPHLLVFPEGELPAASVSSAAAQWLREARATSVALLPVTVDGRTVALATTATCHGNPPADEDDLALLRDVLQQMSGPLRRTLEMQRMRDTALALQQSFLAEPPVVDGVHMEALYQPADSTAKVGGDWYDAVSLSDTALALTIGDIAGHDVDAATAMGRVNSMLRALAYDSGPAASPAATLVRLDRVVQALDNPAMVTAVHAIMHREAPGRWGITLSNAGHPPPLLIRADGEAAFVNGTAADPPLCVSDSLPRTDLSAVLREGDILVLFTDGLVEEPGTDISQNLRQLRDHAGALVATGASLSSLIQSLLPPLQERRDDIAVIALQARAER